jgi:hypothetical protein
MPRLKRIPVEDDGITCRMCLRLLQRVQEAEQCAEAAEWALREGRTT